jgi:alcohol dehydrogenase class IV
MASLRIPSDLAIEAGASDRLAEVARRHGIERPLVVTDPFLRDHGPVPRLVEQLEEAAVFADVQADPTLANVDAALGALREHEADGVIAVGGGSPIDTAKAAAVMATNDGSLRDYAGYDLIPDAGLPVIAVPTTAGTGSEVTRVTVITDTDRDVKMMLRSDALLPRAAVVDYELTLSCPPGLTAHVGVDSLTHASAVTDMFALEAARLIAPNLRRAVADGDDREARAAMMLGATLAGVAFSNASVCLVHGMSRPIGAHFHVPHGLSNAVLLPTVTRYSVGAAPGRYAELARAMGAAAGDSSDAEACDALVEELAALNSDLSIPGIGGLDIERDLFESRLEAMAEAAIASGSPGFNPREPTRDEIVELYRDAY